jgi:3-phenylpropionate/trans-cinnamate dioxygenase ferredoxin reductase component
MPDYRYLIVGGGLTADAAVRGLRELDSSGSIGVIGAEQDPPYARPPLSKALWKGDPVDTIWKHTEETSAELHLGRTVTRLDAERRTAKDDKGTSYGFERVLLATGGSPRRLPFGGDNIIYYRTFRDYNRLREIAAQQKSVAVIGGGFIGSEIAAALAMNGCKVTMLFPEKGIGWRVFPADLSEFLVEYYREKGVEVRPEDSAIDVTRRGMTLDIQTRGGSPLTVDAVVAGIGIAPNVDLATGAGLRLDDGILVDDRLRATYDHVFAAGDVARFYNPALGTRMRVEHEDNAVTMGHAAGRSMAGDETPYTHLPFFYSDLFDLGYEAVGEMDPRTEIVADWKEQFRTGVIYYVADGKVRGVLLWNVWGQVDAARQLIGESEPVRAPDLIGRIPTG